MDLMEMEMIEKASVEIAISKFYFCLVFNSKR